MIATQYFLELACGFSTLSIDFFLFFWEKNADGVNCLRVCFKDRKIVVKNHSHSDFYSIQFVFVSMHFMQRKQDFVILILFMYVLMYVLAILICDPEMLLL